MDYNLRRKSNFSNFRDRQIAMIENPIPTPEQPSNEQFVLLSTIIHRLNNELAIIPPWIELFKEELGTEKVDLRYLDKILQNITSSLEFINEFRSVATSGLATSRKTLQVNNIVQRAVDHYKFPTNVNTQLRLRPSLPKVTVNADILQEVLRIIFDNAVIAIQATSIDGLIEVSTDTVEGSVAIDVTDNSIGIPPEIARNIFRRPIRRKDSMGSGMGLFLANSIIEANQGTMHIVRSGSTGTTIRISLPIALSSATDVADSSSRVLVVDNEQNWREVIVKQLSTANLGIDTAASSEEAFRLIDSNTYDLALLDLRLSNDREELDRTGLDIAKSFRERNPDGLIVILTGFPDYEVVREGFSSIRVDDFLSKADFSREGLNSIIRRVASRKQLERETIRQQHLNSWVYETLAMFSHELRNPLLVAQRNVEALLLGAYGSLSLDQQEVMKAIQSAIRREFVLLNAHLDLNNIEKKVDKLNQQICDLIQLLSEEIEFYQVEAQHKNVSIVANFPQFSAKVRVDVNRLRVAINPLVNNAIKFSPEGGQIKIAAQIFENYVEVQIVDQGPGMKRNEIERIINYHFAEPLDLTQRMRSSGLGLLIAKRTIDLHDGTFWIDSDGKTGTKVNFRLPIIP
jgi:signal transduction histidine kinase